MVQVNDQIADKDVQGVYFIADDNPRFEVVYDSGSGYIPIDMESYKKVEEEFFGKRSLAVDEEVFVDKDWAYALLTSGEETNE